VSFAEVCAQAGGDVVIAARRVEKLVATAQLVTAAGTAGYRANWFNPSSAD
jgi:short-subunit dehydrogenase